MRLRNIMHRGSGEDLLRSLETFNLPRDRVPSDLGGSVVLDINQFLIDRYSVEASRAGINLQPVEDQSSPEGQSIRGVAAAAASHSTNASSNISNMPTADADNEATSTSVVGVAARMEPSPLISNGAHDDGACNSGPVTKRVKTNVPSGTGSSGVGSDRLKGRGAGRGRPDRRMRRALELKLADPNMSLLDALVGGGFVFNDEQAGEVVDTDGVRLAQVSDMMCWNCALCNMMRCILVDYILTPLPSMSNKISFSTRFSTHNRERTISFAGSGSKRRSERRRERKNERGQRRVRHKSKPAEKRVGRADRVDQASKSIQITLSVKDNRLRMIR